MLPLCLTIDPGASAAAALGEPGERPRLLALRVVPRGLGENAWAERAFYVFEALRQVAGDRRVVGWVELTKPGPKNGWQGVDRLSGRRWQLVQAAADAGFNVDTFETINSQTWPGILGLKAGKQGDGSHRIAEAERLVEMDATTLRGLGDATIDAAEAVLMMAALSRRELGTWVPKVKAAPKPRAKAVA